MNPYEYRPFSAFMLDYNERLLREIKKALKVKPIFKARLRLHLWIHSSKKDHANMKFRGYHNKRHVYEIVLITKGHRLVNQTNYKEELNYLITEMQDRVTSICEVGSDWRLVKYFALSYDMYEVKPLRSGSFIPTPEKYSNAKCGLVNIQNKDNRCFMWCMRYHQSPKTNNSSKINYLLGVKDKYDYGEMVYPASFEDIAQFEELNKICIYVYEIRDKVDEETNESISEIIPCKFGNVNYMLNDCIYLLRVEDGDTSHYIYIKRIESLLNLHHHLQDKDNRFCPMCNGSIKLNEYEKHVSLCYKVTLDTTSDRTIIELPKRGSFMEFTNFKNKMVRPYIVYADFECTLIPEGNNKIARHVANSACFYFVCSYDSSKNRLWHSVGENCVQEMLIELNALAEQ